MGVRINETRETKMYKFRNLKLAASFALRNVKPAFVFHGPENGFIVASGKDAKELIADGHKPLSLQETAKAA